MVAPHPQPFSPTPAEADHLLTLIADPAAARSLTEIAAEAGVSLPALTLWLTQPDIAARLDAMESLAARRVRLVATGALPTVVHTLTTILKNYLSSARLPGTPAPTPDHTHRRDETARKAATLLARLSRFTPGPTRQRTLTRQAGDERSPQSHVFSPASTATPEGRGEAHPRVSPSPRSPHLNDAPGPGAVSPISPAGPDRADAAAERPPQAAPPHPHHVPPTDPASIALAILSLPPESVDLSDPETADLLHRLANLPDDAPPDEAQRLVTRLLNITMSPKPPP